MISDILLGVAAGTFIAAVVNHKYSAVTWIKTRYLVWIGIVILITSFILGWPDFKRGFLHGSEAMSQVDVTEQHTLVS